MLSEVQSLHCIVLTTATLLNVLSQRVLQGVLLCPQSWVTVQLKSQLIVIILLLP